MSSNTSNVPTTQQDAPTEKLEGEALISTLAKQIDYYFSKENLANDRYLVSQMNADTYVPIQTIANFKLIKALTSDLDLITRVMKQCPSISVDDSTSMVKPNVKSSRNVIILREIPNNIPVEEVRSLFENDKCGKLLDIRSEIGDCWYATMESEDSALSTLEYLREQTFQGKSIRARIKTDSAFKSFVPGSVTTGAPGSAPYGANADDQGYLPGQAFVPPYNYPFMRVPSQNAEQTNNRGQNYDNQNRRGGDRSNRKQNQQGQRKGRGGDKNDGHANNTNEANIGKNRGGKEQGTVNNTTGRSRRASSGSGNLPQLGPSHFPPLPSKKGASAGYTQDFKKWTRQEIIDIVTSIDNPEKPEEMPEAIAADKPSSEIEAKKNFPKRAEESEAGKEASTTSSSNSASSSNGTSITPNS